MGMSKYLCLRLHAVPSNLGMKAVVIVSNAELHYSMAVVPDDVLEESELL